MKIFRGGRYRAAIVVGLMWFGACAMGAPVSREAAQTAAASFVAQRYAMSLATGVVATAERVEPSVTVTAVDAWSPAGEPIGFLASLEPRGFIVMRADDELTPIKAYSDGGAFSNLPPFFIDVLRMELGAELQELRAARAKGEALTERPAQSWTSLLTPEATVATAPLEADAALASYGPLLSTRWNQNDPYNYYSPTAAGGPGGRAYAGCVATAMGQVMKYHEHPVAVSSNSTYTDSRGTCRGTHSVSDAGLGAYRWTDMPNAVGTASNTSQKEAVGQLLYHAAVTVKMDFESYASGADPFVVAGAIRGFFAYNCGDAQLRSNYTTAVWYNRISADISSNRPVAYGMYDSGGAGHALVCDGCRNTSGREIHLNFGWSGTCDAWYSLETAITITGPTVYPINAQGAIFDIKPLPPAKAANPFPSAGAVQVSPQVDCTWTNGGNAKGYRVYFGTNSNLKTADLKGARTDTNLSYDPGTLGAPVTYYWRVDATNGGGVTTGTVWSFTTAATPCTLTATAGTGGSIVPSGIVSVAYGGSTNVAVAPAPYYHTAQVTVNGAGVATASNYPFVNVTSNQTIEVVFAPDLAAHETPCWWLAAHGASNNFDGYALADSDVDGLTNWQEYVAGTDPTNGQSSLAITGVRLTTQGLQIDWKGGTSAWLYVESTPCVTGTNPAWCGLLTNAPPTSATSLVFRLDSTNRMLLYRIRAARP